MDWQQTTLNRASRDAFIQWVRTPPAERSRRGDRASVRATEPLFALLDAHLATQPYMAGDASPWPTFPVGCEAHRWFGLPAAEYHRPAWPNVERWYADLKARPGRAACSTYPSNERR
jgi:glutathione S-transferase